MNESYDIVLKNGRLIDPVNQINGNFDLAVKNGKIAEIAVDIPESKARRCLNLKGASAIPGIVDLHIHASKWLGGKHSHYMMARAGVTTALDMAGPIEDFLEIARDYGAGLNLACLNYVRPGYTVSCHDPSRDELKEMMLNCMSQGALGVKLLGGHYPVTPEAIDRTIGVAGELNAYVAFHAGSTNKKSDILGMLEAIELAQGRPLHMAHINSYCRGQVTDLLDETQKALLALKENPNIVSESYLSPINGTSAKCTDGVPESQVTIKCLKVGGFEGTEQGLAQAIKKGWAQINMESDRKVALAVGEEALAYWRSHETNTLVCFKVNPPEPRLVLASAKRDAKSFAVDCLSTDGGGIPRNTTVAMGLALVKLGALSLEEFVTKTSTNPASILGLPQKGHLGQGSDADITVVDLEKCSCVMSIAGGELIMKHGELTGSGTTIITSPLGEEALKAQGFKTQKTGSVLMKLPRNSAA